ncbi:MAG: nucleotidyltransferase substrate binding protein [Candidatus Melainabacteria bacterium]|nr:nucleotidyltransferase substrate binding protein [Candidatus Melainabacteria bacterium]
MEQSGIYRHKLSLFEIAVNGFEEVLKINLDQFSKVELDAIKNGQIQKFEYCAELMWKVLQSYINEKIGEDINGPKPAIKAALNNNIINDKIYETLFEMIEARNKLSHIYDQKQFEEIYSKLPDFLKILKNLVEKLKSL